MADLTGIAAQDIAIATTVLAMTEPGPPKFAPRASTLLDGRNGTVGQW